MKNTNRFFAYVCLFFLSGTSIFSQQTINGTLTFDAIERSYIVYVPSGYSAQNPAPLVFNFHGYTNTANTYIFAADFRSVADKEGFLVVYPQGTKDAQGNTHFNVDWPFTQSTVDDVGFTNALLDKITSEYAIDDQRIYSTGFSNGGFFSHKLACELSDRIAAVASVSGSVTRGQFGNCNPTHQMPVLQIHGTSDGVVSYNGSQLFEPVVDVLDFWIDFNDASDTPVISELPNTNTSDNSTVELQVYGEGNNGSVVEHYKINGGTHNWPGNRFDSASNRDINAAEVIWEFFSRYDISGEINTLSRDEVANTRANLLIYPVPSNDTFIIEHPFAKIQSYSLSSAQGTVLVEGKLTSNKTVVDVSGFSKGVYFLTIENIAYKMFKR